MEIEKTSCDVCGKCLVDNDTETTLVGLEISITSSTDTKITEFYQKQMGKYKLDKKYRLCFECWLKSLNLKP